MTGSIGPQQRSLARFPTRSLSYTLKFLNCGPAVLYNGSGLCSSPARSHMNMRVPPRDMIQACQWFHTTMKTIRK
ncbi:unnamed protein product [Pleuronectes platessa]|uniref:Uncharacterized protein n=1 Tax=Pleuronectes platessa TaxID=8262 RepID=A0A9N7V5P3_PLEPL|nr:unnamed protein product [Pleuronectes platessa]